MSTSYFMGPAIGVERTIRHNKIVRTEQLPAAGVSVDIAYVGRQSLSLTTVEELRAVEVFWGGRIFVYIKYTKLPDGKQEILIIDPWYKPLRKSVADMLPVLFSEWSDIRMEWQDWRLVDIKALIGSRTVAAAREGLRDTGEFNIVTCAMMRA